MKKTAVILISILLLSAVTAVSVSAIDVATKQDFNSLASGASITSADNAALQMQIYPKTNSITVADFPSASDKSLKFIKSGTDDPYIQTVFATPVTGVVVMDMKLYIEELNTSASIMFREPTPTFFNVVTFKNDGTIVSNAKNLKEGEKENLIGGWKAKEWIKVVAKVDPSAKKYSVYINEKLVVNEAAISFEKYESIGHARFAIAGDNTQASGKAVIYVDDIRTYTGSAEVQTDEYFGVKAFVPPAAAPTAKTSDANTPAPSTGDPVTLAVMALVLPLAGFAVAKKKRGK